MRASWIQTLLACADIISHVSVFDDTGIATFLTSKYGDPDYIELPALPRSNIDLADSSGARKIPGRKRTERGRYGLYFGYPTHLNLTKSKQSSGRVLW